MDDTLGKKLCLVSPSFFKSDKLFCVYHLICWHLLYEQNLFHEAYTKRSSLHVRKDFYFKFKTSLTQHIFVCMPMSQMVLLCCTSHCILLGSSMCMPINPRKLSFCSFNINCYFNDITFFIFIPSQQQDSLSYLHLSTLIDKNPMERYKSMLETKIIVGNHSNMKLRCLMRPRWIWYLFNIISDSNLNLIASNI